jgi:cystathionine beta-lyase family protein involved in aluminum resistance
LREGLEAHVTARLEAERAACRALPVSGTAALAIGLFCAMLANFV